MATTPYYGRPGYFDNPNNQSNDPNAPVPAPAPAPGTISTGTSFADWNAGNTPVVTRPGQITTGMSFADWNAQQAAAAKAAETPTDPQPVKYGSSGYDADLQAQMDAIYYQATGGRRTPRQDEYDQWLGPTGYLMRDDINGAGQTLKAWTPGSQIDPYWQYRLTLAATGGDVAADDQNAYRDVPQFEPPARTSGAASPAFSAAITSPTITTPSYQYTPAPINTGTPSPTTGASTASGSTGLMMTPEINDEARARILELLQTPQTVDPQALRDSPEMQGVYLMAQRAEERDRAALAERAAAGGWSGSGGFEGGLNALRQQRGETEMQMMGTLAATYMERHREDLQRGIADAMNQGQFEAAQTLQRDLAALNAQLAQERIGADVGMSNADLALRAQLGQGNLSLRSQLGQGDLALRGDQLGFDYAQLQYQANRDATLAALRK